MTDPGPTVRDHLQLLGKFLRHPRTVGAVAPSSAVLARVMVTGVGECEAERIVELGPGTGSFTRAIVRRLGARSRLLAVDLDAAFVEGIRRRWPTVECVCASAEALPEVAAARGFLPVDRIISGLPFASLPEAITRKILDGIEQTLRPAGTFTTFQYVHAYAWPPSMAFRRDLTRRMATEPTATLVMRNVPPAYVLTWRRPPTC
ncbi:MAG TPA: methyltransferase domain-containing protein [Vicinamibacterales bacterium]